MDMLLFIFIIILLYLIFILYTIVNIIKGRINKEIYEYPEELKDRTMNERLKRHEKLVEEFMNKISSF